MPSIQDLFADPDLQGEEEDHDIDIDKVLASVTDVLNDRSSTPGAESPPRALEQEHAEEPSSEEPVSGEDGDEGEDGEEPGEVEDPPPPSPASLLQDRVEPSTAPRVADPFLELPPDRRAAVLAIDQALMSDEGKRAEVFRILSGDSSAPATPKPTLPEHIDPDSFEAQIWRHQQEQDQVLRDIGERTKAQQAETERVRAVGAAERAGSLFAQRYSGKLTQDDVMEIAKHAGQPGGVAGMFVNTPEGRRDPVAAFDQALEHTLWTVEAFRTRVLDTGADERPPGEQPEAVERKRKLTAVGSAASPVSGPAPQRPPLETGADGRLAEKSRQQLVKELATDIARQS
jgi:hypothetical protein